MKLIRTLFLLFFLSLNVVVVFAQKEDAIKYFNSGLKKLNQDRDTVGALADFSKSLTLDSTNRNAIFNRGLIYICQKRYNEALLDFDNAIKLYPRYPELYGNRGNLKLIL